MNNLSVNHLDGDYGLTNKIKDALKEAAKQFIYIGFLLKEAEEYGYYREGGYDNIYDYCEENFGFGRSSTNNFIRVYRQFGTTNGIGLMDNYKAYSYSQLTEMCSMNMKQLNQCNPYMTVKELRMVKKGTAPIKLAYTIEPDEVTEPEKVVYSVQTSGRGSLPGIISLHHLCALERYLFDRFSGNKYYDSPESLQSFVINTGCDFSFNIFGEGSYPVEVFCYPENVEINFNGNKAYVPYSVVYYVYDVLSLLKSKNINPTGKERNNLNES